MGLWSGWTIPPDPCSRMLTCLVITGVSSAAATLCLLGSKHRTLLGSRCSTCCMGEMLGYQCGDGHLSTPYPKSGIIVIASLSEAWATTKQCIVMPQRTYKQQYFGLEIVSWYSCHAKHKEKLLVAGSTPSWAILSGQPDSIICYPQALVDHPHTKSVIILKLNHITCMMSQWAARCWVSMPGKPGKAGLITRRHHCHPRMCDFKSTFKGV